MDGMEKLTRAEELLIAKAAGNLTADQLEELKALREAQPELLELEDEMDHVDAVLREFGPLIEARDFPPVAQFPEYRMGQFTTAVWENFRDTVPARERASIWQGLWHQAFPLGASALAAVAIVYFAGFHEWKKDTPVADSGTIAVEPVAIAVASDSVTPPATDSSLATMVVAAQPSPSPVIEFGVYDPVSSEDYGFRDLLSRFDVTRDEALGAVDALNKVAQPMVRSLSFELIDGFEQWKNDSFPTQTMARVWIDGDLDTLHVVRRDGDEIEMSSQDLPLDEDKRDAMIREALANLADLKQG
jgi:hypothetical protein